MGGAGQVVISVKSREFVIARLRPGSIPAGMLSAHFHLPTPELISGGRRTRMGAHGGALRIRGAFLGPSGSELRYRLPHNLPYQPIRIR